MEYKKNDSPEPEDSKVKSSSNTSNVASGTSIRTHYPWIPVNSDEVKMFKSFFS